MTETLGIDKQPRNNGGMEFWNDGFIFLSNKETSFYTHYSIIPMFQHSIRVEVRWLGASSSTG
jgi:hypothetical protein